MDVSGTNAREQAAELTASHWSGRVAERTQPGDSVSRPVVLDCGCGTGDSTRALQQVMGRDTEMYIGLDCNQYYMAVGMQEALVAGTGYKHQWLHGSIEDPPVKPGSVDIAFVSFVMHEVPRTAWPQILQGIYRSLAPGGTVAILDVDPEKANAGFAISEPFFADYRSVSPKRELLEGGFTNIVQHSVGRNVLYLATKLDMLEEWNMII